MKLVPLVMLVLGLLLLGTLRAQEPDSSGKKQQPQQKPAQGQEKPPESKPLPQFSPDARYDYQGEAVIALQTLPSFHSAYSGSNSFRARNETELTHDYTLFLGARIVRNLEVYLNPELAWGSGLSEGTGLAGYVNGNLLGQASLRPEPYLARYFVRWRIPLPGRGETAREVQVGRAPNLIEGSIPSHRLVVSLGKLGVTDSFDVNSYANNPRTQFMNKSFGNNLAFDYAQETRGYNLGAVIGWINPTWALRFGLFSMPTSAGGPDLAFRPADTHSEQVEVEIHPKLLRGKHSAAIVRLLFFRNVGAMGRYREAISTAAPGAAPDLSSVERNGAVKYGFGVNLEQGLMDGGATGVFARAGWNDGTTESFNYTEADRSLSVGIQLSGVHWKREDDRVGIAIAQSGLSNPHKDYLAAGGTGFSLGDGDLHYRSERVAEVYYSYQLNKVITVALDYQFLANPGYNRDRGPVSVFGLRTHLAF